MVRISIMAFNMAIAVGSMILLGSMLVSPESYQQSKEEEDKIRRKYGQVSFRDPKLAADHAKKLEELNKRRSTPKVD